jgi:hypothetical protein
MLALLGLRPDRLIQKKKKKKRKPFQKEANGRLSRFLIKKWFGSLKRKVESLKSEDT